MADLGKAFNANVYEELGDFSPLATGDYNVAIESTEKKVLNSGNGDKLVITYSVNGGDSNGRKLFDNLNLWHATSQDAAHIAARTLAQICRVVGREQIRDTDELVGSSLSVRVDVEEREGKKYNRIKAYNKLNGSLPAVSNSPGVQGPAPAANSNNKMPWEK